METKENTKQEKVESKKEEPKSVTVEQVAQRLQILNFEIKQRQTEYNNLHSQWIQAMTKPREDGVDKK